MAAAATPEPPTGVSLIELALGAGYRFGDQRWRLHAACAGADPEVFLPDRGASHEEPMSYCRRCPVRGECLEAALDLGQKAHGVWGGVSGRERRLARRNGWDAARLLAELDR
jgi:WhiB family redox-sensing transcriptional regulator